jgi:Fe-Mn family superoxide dismutase
MFKLPQLAFKDDALAPTITAEGFTYHYGKHHQTYVNNLNNLVKNSIYENLTLIDIIIESSKTNDTPVFNNAAQHFNHSFFWNCLSDKKEQKPNGEIEKRIIEKYGSFEEFKALFSEKAIKLFGSGWVWLVLTEDKQLDIIPLKDADTPLTNKQIPLLTIDVWEHAYYIDHRNARAQFVAELWNIINWEFVEEQLISALK